MVELIPPPDPLSLLPPLLACLPTSFASPRPPPALLPLLSPILRQRLNLNTSGASRDNWSPLLTWDVEKGDALKDTIENTVFEPHPASGEIEVGEVAPITYKRFDEETLKAQVSLQDWPFTVLYLWCTGGEDGNGWRVSELFPFSHELQSDSTWSRSISEANESSRARLVDEAIRDADRASAAQTAARRNLGVQQTTDEDDYWAMYDKSEGRTPARQGSIEPTGQTAASEDDYYNRYGSVQPAVDAHDPDEDVQGATESSLNGNALESFLSRQLETQGGLHGAAYPSGLDRHDPEDYVQVNQPIPSSPSSRGSDTIARLEEHAERLGASDIGIRQHIGSTVKSMYRLAKSAGMERDEFERLVQRELETLSIYDRND
ncbi:hypothetical protein PV10_03198 [Exophiala mesophila]|uniref:Uncharacterized protein n=1 Tax=Exophiala mesophila TaxID=212818 RepID=A0A0D1Y4I2_EXOME|nr:uncharacterized protein PV10_03198 [Exophiala mesophila]KIV95561.1 hypothetical protein PV10_03198 [Exophiala mesophila]